MNNLVLKVKENLLSKFAGYKHEIESLANSPTFEKACDEWAKKYREYGVFGSFGETEEFNMFLKCFFEPEDREDVLEEITEAIVTEVNKEFGIGD